MIYPVSVIIPHQKSRAGFFGEVCLPSVKLCKPAQIIIMDRDGGAQEKRNQGAAIAVCDYLLFVDDDTELMPNCIGRMFEGLQRHSDKAFCYSDHFLVDHLGYQLVENLIYSRPWDHKRLQRENFVDTCSLIRVEHFPGFDRKIKRLQDWDLFLTISERGGSGLYLPGPLFKSHHIDKGISDTFDFKESVQIVREKHGL
jgi:hypothetical protein